MDNLKGKFGSKAVLKIAMLGMTGLGLSGCYSDFGASGGYYTAGYDSYACDPYGGYDSYYDCDYGYGFNNIGYSGGWYDNFYYPGYGLYLFDNYGRRHDMDDRHRRYWSGRRHDWKRQHGDKDGQGHGGNWNGNGNHGNGNGNGSWNQNGGNRGDGDWRRDRNDDDRNNRGNGKGGWKRNTNQGSGAVTTPATGTPPVATGQSNGGNWRRGQGENNNGGRNWSNGQNQGAVNTAPRRPNAAPVIRSAPPQASVQSAPAPRPTRQSGGRILYKDRDK